MNTKASKIDLSHFTRLPIIKEIDKTTLPELSSKQTLFIPMCARANNQVLCDHTDLIDNGEPSHIDDELRYYTQPVIARLKEGKTDCANCLMPIFPKT